MRNKESHPAERQPLMNKLEPTHSNRNNFHHEAQEWSKTGRNFAQMIMDALKALFSS